MYTDKKVLIGAVLGILLGCLFVGIYADKLYRENKMLKSSLYEQTQQTHEWMRRFASASKERDLVSDIIHAKMDYEAAGINKSMSEVTDEFLSDTTLTSIDWSYCY